MRINVLEPQIFNKIAAGEVVERPASIVKELVDNCIDAGATNITVDIENGGITKIRVTDNGCGINYEDLVKAFLPHATSKIKTTEDLFEIKTLGFRGEALASIGAVSRVSLVSKTADSQTGGRIEINGGEMGKPEECGSGNGTDIIVRDLFFNVPARAKFLKKPKTEEGEVTDLIEKAILANPCVSIKYVIDGKIKYLSTGKGIKDSMYEIYGKSVIDNTIYFEQDFYNMKIYGYTSKPNFTKPNKTYQTIILNNRYIQSNIISGAVMNAYGEILMKKQFPFFVLYIELDYASVDVNVHPNKLEVRFENGGEIYRNVFETINRAINSIDYTRNLVIEEKQNQNSVELPNFSEEVVIDDVQPVTGSVDLVTENQKISISEVNLKTTEFSDSHKSEPLTFMEKEEPSIYKQEPEETKNLFNIISNMSDQESVAAGISFGSKLLNEQQSFKHNTTDDQFSFNVLGVLFNTYIIAEFDDSMLLIDQHAGHERVLFDKFMKQVTSQQISTQPMFTPFILDVNSLEYNYIIQHLNDLKELGFEIDEFGVNSFRIDAMPCMLEEINLKDFFAEFLSDMNSLKTFTYENAIRDKIASMACKAAVKAGDKLSTNEINYLIGLFVSNNTKLLCPHGRPVVIQIEQKEIEKWFKRIV